MRKILLAMTLTLGWATLGWTAQSQAQATTFQIRNDGGSRAQFESDAPLETITGVSSHVTGELRVDPNQLSGARGTIRVRVDSIRTGVTLRDEHLRGSNWLDAERFENAEFTLTGVEGASRLTPNADSPQRLTLIGRFTLHGRTRNVRARARVRFMPNVDQARLKGDVIRGRAQFTVRLSDYGVSIPLLVRAKVSNEITVSIDLRAVHRSSAQADD